MSQAVLFSLIYFIGWGFNRVALKLDRSLSIFFGFLVGTLLCVAVIVLLLSFGWYEKALMVVLLIVGAGVSIGKILLLLRMHKIETIAVIFYGMVFCLLATLLDRYNFTIASFDSYRLILIGRAWANAGGFGDFLAYYLSSWGVYAPALQSLSNITNNDYLSALQPSIAASGFLAVFLLFFRCIKNFSESRTSSLLYTSLSTVLIASSYFWIFQSFYIHNSLPASLWLSTLVMCWWLYYRTFSKQYLALALCGAIGFLLQRTETPLVLAIVFVCGMGLYGSQAPKQTRQLVYYVALASIIWYLFIIFSIGSGSDILSPGKVLLLLAPLIAYSFLLYTTDVSQFSSLTTILEHMPIMMTLGSVFLLCVAVMYEPVHMTESLSSVLANLSRHGRWGALWYAVVFLLSVSLFYKPFKGERYWVGILVTYLCLIFMLALARIPYRVGWGDSANRMMTHFLPLLFCYFSMKFTGQLVIQKSKVAKCIKIFLMIMSTLFLLSLLLYQYALTRPNMLKKAVILEAPNWIPGYEISVTYESPAEGKYAAPYKRGSTSVIFKLEEPVNSGVIEVLEYSEALKMLDFQWSISSNGEIWTAFYIEGENNFRKEREFNEIHYCLGFQKEVPIRYLKLDFVRGRGQDRLLLKHLSLKSNITGRGFLSRNISELYSRLSGKC